MVKPGYKQTEVGVIPIDWQVKTIGELGYVTSGESPSRFAFDNGNIPYFKVDQLNNSTKYQERTPYKIKYEHPVEKGSIIFPKRGAAIATNKVRILKDPSFFDTNIMSITFTSKLAHSEFFYYYLVRKELWQIADTTSVPQINNKHILPLLCPFPSLVEQERIAKALSDVDSMISSLEKLIKKKKAVKQGAMQELLTGKKRLPGFDGEWKVYKLDELLKYEQPTKYIVHSAKYAEQGIPVLTAGKSLILGYTTENDGIYENLPVIIFDDFVTSSKYITYRFKVKSSAMKMLTLKNEEMNLKLIFELMQMIDFVPVDHQRHWISQYSQFEIKLPPTMEEQTAIASILSDMDNEIEALEQKLEKTRQIKQGMMQQLLTGKIRLV